MEGTYWEHVAQWSEVVGGFAFIIVMVFIFRKFVLPAVASAEVQKNAELVNAEKRREELRAEAAEARLALESSERDAIAIGERAIVDAQRVHDHIIAEARRDATALLHNAQGEFERARNTARDRLRIEFIERALVAAREIAAKRVDAKLDAELVATTFDDLASGKAS